MSNTTSLLNGPVPLRSGSAREPGQGGPNPTDAADIPTLWIVPWVDPIADPHGLPPCSRYVELYWLPIIGPSTTWLLRRLSYGLEVHEDGFDLHLAECARSLGLGDRLGKNSPFCRAIQRLRTFELGRATRSGRGRRPYRHPPTPFASCPAAARLIAAQPSALARRAFIDRRGADPPPGPTAGHRARRRAGKERTDIERRLADWQFHPAVAFRAAETATEDGGVAASLTRCSGPDEAPDRYPLTNNGALTLLASGKPRRVAA